MPTQPLDPPRPNDAPGIRKEDDLQEDLRIVRGTAGLIILIPDIKQAQIHMVVNQDVDGVLKGAS